MCLEDDLAEEALISRAGGAKILLVVFLILATLVCVVSGIVAAVLFFFRPVSGLVLGGVTVLFFIGGIWAVKLHWNPESSASPLKTEER